MKRIILALILVLALSSLSWAAAVQIGTTGYERKSSRNVVRLASGTLIAAFIDNTSHLLKMYSSPTGATWTEFTGTAPAAYVGAAIATDGTNWYVTWYLSAISLYYATGSGTAYPTGEAVQAVTAITGNQNVAICLDASNIPHVVYGDLVATFDTVYYTNRVGGAWNTKVEVEGTSASKSCNSGDITIDTTNAAGHRYNIPQISYAQTTDLILRAALGNANNATSFTLVRPATETAGAVINVTSIAIDTAGYTNIAFIKGNSNLGTVYIPGTSTWGTAGNWTSQLAINDANSNYSVSIAINGTDRYVSSDDSNTGYIRYAKSAGYAAFDGPTTIEASAKYFSHFRWQYANNPSYSTYGIDYVCGNDPLYWNKIILASPNLTVNGVSAAATVDGVANPAAVDGVVKP